MSLGTEIIGTPLQSAAADSACDRFKYGSPHPEQTRIRQGDVSPSGWGQLFAPKPKS
jgi:hypothetical protein